MTEALPSKLVAGDTWSWTMSFADYPAPTWSATAYFENADGTFSAAATVAGAAHVFTVLAATTAVYRAGRYKVSIRVTDGSQATTVESGWLDVLTNPAAPGTSDPRSDARKMLDALNQTLIGRATNDQLSMTLNGRALSRIPLVELRQWRDQLRQEVKVEEQGERAGLGRNIKTRFSRG